MRLYILRHAEAEDHASSDFARQLTPKGREQARVVGEFLRRQEIKPDLVAASPYLRSWQTAEEVCAAAGLEAPVREPLLGCGMTPEQGLAILKSYQDQFPSLLIVGHQPDLGEFMDTLLGTTQGAGGGNVHVRKASLAGFWVHSLREGGGVLEFFVPVRFLK
jgi:phosphohistidine phosphatase